MQNEKLIAALELRQQISELMGNYRELLNQVQELERINVQWQGESRVFMVSAGIIYEETPEGFSEK